MKKIIYTLICGFLISNAKADKFPVNSLKGNNEKEISFIENKGQVADQNNNPRPDVLFSGTDGKMVFHIKNNGFSYQLNKIESWKVAENSPGAPSQEVPEMIPDQTTLYRIDAFWKNCNTNLQSTTDITLPGFNNYYLPVCPNGATNVKSFSGITLKNLYNNIDIHYYSKNGMLKHDYIVAAGADYKQIQIELKGAEISLEKDGTLLLKTILGNIQEGAPLVFQDGKQIKSNWILENNVLSFNIPSYDKSKELIIDPLVRVWGTYYGGSGVDYGYGCSVDGSGNSFHAGYSNTTFGTAIATVGSHQAFFGGSSYDAYLVKFNSAGVRQWGTYYGGIGLDYGQWCTTDGSGNSYLSGYTQSTGNISTAGCHQFTFGGSSYDGFLVKFNTNGIRQWGTYYGGTGVDYGQRCATDPSGNVYFTGYTQSTNNISTAGCHQFAFGGSSYDAFVVKFNSAGVRQWGTYYGGTALDYGFSVGTDASNNVYLGGYTGSMTNISTAGAHQTVFGGSSYDAFLVKFNTSGVRQWGTYYGGTSLDYGQATACDNTGNVYLAGYAQSTNAMATPGAHQTVFGGSSYDAFLVKFNTSGVRQWGTYYGGTALDYGQCVATGTSNVYLSGHTGSNTGTVIATPGSHQASFGGSSYDGYIAEFNSAGVRQWATYYGGTGLDYAGACAASTTGFVYISGYSGSNTGTVIATAGGHQPTHGFGTYDGYIAQFQNCNLPMAPNNTTPPQNQTICAGFGTTLTATGSGTLNWFATPSSTPVLGTGTTFTTPILAQGTYSYYVEAYTCSGGPRTEITVTVNPSPTITATSGTICPGGTLNLNPVGGVTYTFNPNGPIVTPSITSSFTITGTGTNGCVGSPVVITVTVLPSPTITVNSGSICLGQTFTLVPSGAVSYTYSGGSATVTPVTTTTYYVTGDAGGCVSQNPAVSVVTVGMVPSVTVTGPGSMCQGQTINLQAFGAPNYSWSTGAITSTIAVSPTTTTNYSIVGTGTNGCGGSTVIKIVIVNSNPNVTISSASTVMCRGESMLLTANSADTYSWSNGALTPTIVISPTTNVSYTVTGTNTLTGCVNTKTISISVNVCTGIEQTTLSGNEFKLYPNPNSGEFFVEVSQSTEFKVFNSLGQIVIEKLLTEGKNEINFSSVAKGVYFVQLKTENKIKTIKIIRD